MFIRSLFTSPPLKKWLKQNKKSIRKFANLSFLLENIFIHAEFLHWKISYKKNYTMSPEEHDLHCEIWHRIFEAEKIEREDKE